MRLTQTVVNNLQLPPGKNDFIVFDEKLSCFGLRIREGGSRKFVVQYKLGALTRRMTLGSTAVLTAQEAYEAARKILAEITLTGKDPAGEKQVNKAQAGETFSVVVKRFLQKQKASLRAKTYIGTERYLLNHCASFHPLPLTHVSKRMIAERVSQIATDSGPSAADQCRAKLSAFFAWAMREGLVDANPVIATNTHGSDKGRERVLSIPELVEVWHAAEATNPKYAALIKLLILTGQRRTEIGSLAWGEVDLAEKVIRLPAERTKNGVAHLIPLAFAAQVMIEELPRIGKFVLGNTPTGFSSYSRGKASLDEKIAANRKAQGREDMPAWTIHDLRRSLATHMNELGIAQPHIVEAVLNHVGGHKAGVAGTYNRATYENEKRKALDTWADKVTAAVEDRGTNIVPLRA
jgi:integrase